MISRTVYQGLVVKADPALGAGPRFEIIKNVCHDYLKFKEKKKHLLIVIFCSFRGFRPWTLTTALPSTHWGL
jgi:hypothetical protein